MDQVGREHRGPAALTCAPDRASRLARPLRFDPPPLTPVLTADDIAAKHADQLAAAMSVAREEGLRSARLEVESAVAHHEAAAAELHTAAMALHAAVDQLARRDEFELDAVQQQAVLFGASLAEELIGRELRCVDDVVLSAMERAVALVPDRGELSVRLNPADVEVVQRCVVEVGGFGDRTALVPDVNVGRGGCVVTVGALRIDAQLPPALARVRALLEG